MTDIKWTEGEDVHKISEIVERAGELLVKCTGKSLDTFSAEMDISAVNANGCPLNLDKLLSFEDSDFGHDVFGIVRHIDRKTGTLKDCFFPRCAR